MLDFLYLSFGLGLFVLFWGLVRGASALRGGGR